MSPAGARSSGRGVVGMSDLKKVKISHSWQSGRLRRPLSPHLELERWVGVRVVGVGLLSSVSVGLWGYQTRRRVVGAAGFLAVVLLDRLLFRFPVSWHLDRPPRCGRLLCLCVA